MSYQTVSRTTRHDTSVAWYRPPDEYKSYLKSNYEDTGKIINISRVFSEGGTSRYDASTIKTVTVTWKDKASNTEWRKDETCLAHVSARNTYEAANNFSRIKPGQMEMINGSR